jgi:hypothetical protein
MCHCGQIGKYNKLCTTKSCSKKCCTDSHCSVHFDTFEEMTTDDANDIKMILYNQKPQLSVDLINLIVDGYVDNRLKCYNCNFKFLDLDDAFSYGYIAYCHMCNKCFCENCFQSKMYGHEIFQICDACIIVEKENNEIELLDMSENDSDD